MRKSILAGSWYPGTKQALAEEVTSMLHNADPALPDGRIYAVISPHAGYRYSGKAAAYGYKIMQDSQIDRVFILAPSHRWPFHGVSIIDAEAYETPLGLVPVDTIITSQLREHPLIANIAQADIQEHSLEIQLPFIQHAVPNMKIIPMVVGDLEDQDYQSIADAMKPFIDEKTVIVISSDFTHYGYNFSYLPFRSDVKANLAKLDGGAVEQILAKNFSGFSSYLDKTGATICGRDPIKILLKLLPEQARGQELIYYTSGDLTNDYSNSVSYVSIVFTVPEDAATDKPINSLAGEE